MMMKMTKHSFSALLASLLVVLLTGWVSADEAGQQAAKDIMIDENTFGCITDMTRVDRMYVDNLLGDSAGTIAAAEEGGTFPVGSALRLIPDEIMVKGKPGSHPSTGDWMFVRLGYDKDSGKQSVTTGFEEVTNFLNLTCFSCHVVAGPANDFICGDKEGNKNCAPIPFDRPMLHALQNTDPRCESQGPVSPEDAEALARLQEVVKELLDK